MTPPTVKQLLDWMKPLPPTHAELEWAEAIKPGEYEIYSERLNNIVLEAKEICMRSAITIFARTGDLCVGIFTARGDMVTCYAGMFHHAVSTLYPIKYILQNFEGDPTVGIKEGDVFYFNEASYGGMHCAD